MTPNNPLSIAQEAHAYDLQGQMEKAESGYRAALQIDPKLDQANLGLGRILVLKGELRDALAHFVSISETAANTRLRAEGAYSAGTVSQALNRPTSAEEFMRLSTTTDPEYALGWVGLGTVLFNKAISTPSAISSADRVNLLSASFQALQKAISINSKQTAAYYQIGIESAALGKTEIARKFLHEALVIAPADVSLNGRQRQAIVKSISVALSVIENSSTK